MKKLLSLLSVLTISGSAVPTTIAASPYRRQAQENKLENSEINYKQTNNKVISPHLQNNDYSSWDIVSALWKIGIKKVEETKDYLVEKIENITSYVEKEYFSYYSGDKNENGFTTEKLEIDYNAKDFFKNLYKILMEELVEKDIVIKVLDSESEIYYVINPNSNIDYFEVPLSIDDREGFRLVFRTSDFYLQGFVIPVENNNTTKLVYYYFDDSEIRFLEDTISDNNLGYNSSYRDLVDAPNQEISWTSVYNSFTHLSNFSGNDDEKDKLKKFLAQIILATAESMRFPRVKNLILSTYNNENTLNWERDFSSIINNWSRRTEDAVDYLQENGNLNNFGWKGIVWIFMISLFEYVTFDHCQSKNNMYLSDVYLTNDKSDNEYCFYLPEKNFSLNDETFYNKWKTKRNNNFNKEYYLNFNKINPTSFKKISFFGEPYTIVSWGKNSYYGNSTKNLFDERNNEFHDIITEFDNDKNIAGYLLKYLTLQTSGEDSTGVTIPIHGSLGSKLQFNQKIALFYYKKNDNYYLVINLKQYVGNISFFSNPDGGIWGNIGNEIKFYND